MENISPNRSPFVDSSPTPAIKSQKASSGIASNGNAPSTPKRPERVGKLGPKRLNMCSACQNLLSRFELSADETNRRKMNTRITDRERWQFHEKAFNDRITTKRPPLKNILGEQNLPIERPTKSRLNWKQSIPLTEAQRGKGLSDWVFTKRLRDRCSLLASGHILGKGKENRKIPGNPSRAQTMKHQVHAPFRDRHMRRAINHSIPAMNCARTASDMVKILCQYTEVDTSPQRYIGHRDTTTTCFNNLLSKLPDRREESPVQQLSDSEPE